MVREGDNIIAGGGIDQLVFLPTLECELLDRQRFPTQAEAKMAVFDYVEMFYNRTRRHSHLGGVSPEAFEEASRSGPYGHLHK